MHIAFYILIAIIITTSNCFSVGDLLVGIRDFVSYKCLDSYQIFTDSFGNSFVTLKPYLAPYKYSVNTVLGLSSHQSFLSNCSGVKNFYCNPPDCQYLERGFFNESYVDENSEVIGSHIIRLEFAKSQFVHSQKFIFAENCGEGLLLGSSINGILELGNLNHFFSLAVSNGFKKELCFNPMIEFFVNSGKPAASLRTLDRSLKFPILSISIYGDMEIGNELQGIFDPNTPAIGLPIRIYQKFIDQLTQRSNLQCDSTDLRSRCYIMRINDAPIVDIRLSEFENLEFRPISYLSSAEVSTYLLEVVSSSPNGDAYITVDERFKDTIIIGTPFLEYNILKVIPNENGTADIEVYKTSNIQNEWSLALFALALIIIGMWILSLSFSIFCGIKAREWESEEPILNIQTPSSISTESKSSNNDENNTRKPVCSIFCFCCFFWGIFTGVFLPSLIIFVLI